MTLVVGVWRYANSVVTKNNSERCSSPYNVVRNPLSYVVGLSVVGGEIEREIFNRLDCFSAERRRELGHSYE